MDFSVWVNLRLDPVRQSFKVLPRAKKAAHKEAVFSHYAHWWLSMCLHHLQDLLMLQLVLQPHGRAMGLGWMGWLPPCTHHPSPRGYHATPLALLQLTSRTVGWLFSCWVPRRKILRLEQSEEQERMRRAACPR